MDPPVGGCFHAFDRTQYARGLDSIGAADGDITHCDRSGGYYTEDGWRELNEFNAMVARRVMTECTPQEVYDSEHAARECGWLGDDSEAMGIVEGYFGADAARKVRRKIGCRRTCGHRVRDQERDGGR
jgi:hypothetical protein